MDTFETILFEEKNGAAWITLNRPDRFNAFNEKLSFELKDALKICKKKEEIRAVVITGAGKAFCSGQDLKDISGQKNRSLSDSLYKRYNPLIKSITGLDKPVIAAVNGVAAGAGCSLALACDYIVAAETAAFIEVFVNVGLVLDSGSSFFLPRVVGSKKAFELATKGSKVKAAEALSLGMVNEVVAADKLHEAVEANLAYYTKAPTKAIGMIKQMIQRSQQSTLDEMLQYEAYCQEIAGRSEDYQEGVAAFMEKRKPNFKGQ